MAAPPPPAGEHSHSQSTSVLRKLSTPASGCPRALVGRNAMKLPRRQFLHLAASAAALPALSRIAKAQAYPARPIRLVVPFPPGGAFDAVGRPWADRMKPLLGTVVVENIGGGGSSLGASAVARAGLTATRSCSVGRRRTSMKPCSRAGRYMIRSKTWIRLRVWPPIFSASPCILRYRFRR